MTAAVGVAAAGPAGVGAAGVGAAVSEPGDSERAGVGAEVGGDEPAALGTGPAALGPGPEAVGMPSGPAAPGGEMGWAEGVGAWEDCGGPAH